MNIFRDGLLEEIDAKPVVSKTREGHTVESYTTNGVKRYFVTLAGLPCCAHGSTIAEAIADATWKDEKKRPQKEALAKEIREAGPSRSITLQEFRLLTGACAEGCKVALKKKGLDGSPMTVEAIKKIWPDWGDKLHAIIRGD